jgi:hypothetical protein
LVSWLTLRATEQQTRRIESIEANQRADALAAAVRPASPSIRFIPQGTPLEMPKQTSAPASSAGGVRGLERLHSEAPAAIKPAGADKATATVGTAQPAPPPAVHSPLDLLFRSQN